MPKRADGSSEVDELVQRGVLGALPADARSKLLAQSQRLELPIGSTLYREEGTPRVALVVSGVCRVYLSSADGRQVTIRYARRGDLLGLTTAAQGPVATGVQALTPVDVLAIPAEPFEALARTHAPFAWAIAQGIGARLQGVLLELAGNTFGTVREKVARHLLELGALQGERLVVRATQKDVADAVGSVREVVARILVELRSRRVLGAGRPGTLVVLDAEALHAQAYPHEARVTKVTPASKPGR